MRSKFGQSMMKSYNMATRSKYILSSCLSEMNVQIRISLEFGSEDWDRQLALMLLAVHTQN